jgi:cytochrome c peroxidase
MLMHGHGMGVTPRVEKVGDDEFRVAGVKFHMAGDWELEVLMLVDSQLREVIIPVTLEDARYPRSGSSSTELVASLSPLTFQIKQSSSPSQRQLALLGRALFFDERLARKGDLACASCHRPEYWFAEPEAVPKLRSGIQRNTPSVVNIFASNWFFWDGRADSAEAQALEPLLNPQEHGLSPESLAKIMMTHYRAPYEQLFGPMPQDIDLTRLHFQGPATVAMGNDILERILITLPKELSRSLMWEARRTKVSATSLLETRYLAPVVTQQFLRPIVENEAATQITSIALNAAKAIAAFERGLIAVESPFDRFARIVVSNPHSPVESAFSADFAERELAGLKVFLGRGQCILCHSGPAFSDQQFHNVGVPDTELKPDLGRLTGIQLLRASLLSCRAGKLPQTDSESCREQPWLNDLSLQTIAAFKTPSLRNVAMTAPYGHNGSLPTLRHVLKRYQDRQGRSFIGQRELTSIRLDLSDGDIEVLEHFLNSLTSEVTDLTR